MALLDFLKRKKQIEKAKEKSTEKPQKEQAEKPTKASVAKETEAKKPAKTGKSKKAGTFSYSMVKEPHISEKATLLGEKHKYTFRVASNANKPEIKKSVEGIYGVNVLSVNIIKVPKKKRRIGRSEGFKKGYAKAVVTIKEGQKIEIF